MTDQQRRCAVIAGGHADPDGPPSKSTVDGGAEAHYQLPKASITVLRGKIGE